MGSLKAVVDPWMHDIATLLEIAGASIIVLGAVWAIGAFFYAGLATVGWTEAYHRFRANLGRGILLGLEFLVAADIIGTIAFTPTLQNLGVLAAIIAIRTFLSFALETEIEGRWPWRRAYDQRASSPLAEKH